MSQLKVLVALSLLLLGSANCDCPNVLNADISPCVCLSNQIRCEGKSVTDETLKSVLAKIDKSRPEYLKTFEGLELYNTAVTKITTEIFGNLNLRSFIKLNENPITSLSLGNFAELVYLDAANNKLANISSSTFLGLKSLEYINLGGNQIENFPKDTFSHSDNLQRLVLTENKIKKLVSDQFSSEYNNNIELNEIDLSYNDLTLIPDNIFWPLRRPVKINLAHNSLGNKTNAIELNALSFGEDVWQNEPIKLLLSSNGIKDADLTNQTLAHIVQQRLSVELDLSENSLTHVNEKVFQGFLRANPNSALILNNNPIKCLHCGNEWLLVDKQINLKNQIRLNKCSDDTKRTLSQLTEADFKSCHP
jgi:Leucine-rich repeat (LRR) protein